MVAVTVDGRWLCFRQTKYAVEGVSLAPVGGYLEPGEDPLLGAQRELFEETGYEAPDWLDLGQFAGRRQSRHRYRQPVSGSQRPSS